MLKLINKSKLNSPSLKYQYISGSISRIDFKIPRFVSNHFPKCEFTFKHANNLIFQLYQMIHFEMSQCGSRPAKIFERLAVIGNLSHFAFERSLKSGVHFTFGFERVKRPFSPTAARRILIQLSCVTF